MRSQDTRDMFAAAAMAALVESQSAVGILGDAEDLAAESYDIAEAMMRERSKRAHAYFRQAENEVDAYRQMGGTE